MTKCDAYIVDGMNIARFHAWSVGGFLIAYRRIGPIFKGQAALGTYDYGIGGKSSVNTRMHKYFPRLFC